ncbi:MAG TPA: RsmE family RNA methyltransferase [Acidimicrobiales bacterium]|nr:RsmE family RNA methyltransferase [Acidimicrobiales bacterium]
MDAAPPPRVAAQVFVSDPTAPDVAAEDRHHLIRVLRLAPGELVIAADGSGSLTLCRFTGSGPLLEPTGPVTRHTRPPPAITIGFAPVKGDRPEWVVQKLTELGVDRIVPLVTERSLVVWSGSRADRALERLRKVARQAAAQSRRSWLPEVAEPLALSEFARQVCAAGGEVALADRDGQPPSLERPVLAIGPEGGWSEAERELGLARVALGDAVLRAETAAVAAGTLLAGLRLSLVGGLANHDP